MINLPFSITLLAIVSIIIYLGFAERILARMRLNDKTAVILLVVLILGHFFPQIQITQFMALNLSILVPLGIVGYLSITTTRAEQLRAIFTSLAVGTILWFTDTFLPVEPGFLPIDLDPMYIAGISAGIVAYLLGRSRRSAFIGAILGTIFVDLLAVVHIANAHFNETLIIGSGGMFNAALISGIIAVGISEIIGEIKERIYRGPAELNNEEDK